MFTETGPETTGLDHGMGEEGAVDPDPDGGGDDSGGGQGEGEVTSSSPMKTKPNDGGGSLKNRILLWEKKTKIVNKEKCTQSNTAGELRRNFGDRQETVRSALGKAWLGNKQS